MNSKLWLLGVITGVTIFFIPAVQEKIALTFLKTTVGLEIISVQKSDTDEDHIFSVPSKAVVTNNQGLHTVYKITGDLFNTPKEEIISVTLKSEEKGKATIVTQNLQEGDRLLINKKLHEKFEHNRP